MAWADRSFVPSFFLICSVTGGVLNMVLDYVLVTGFDMGISGAAVATGLVTGIITMMYNWAMLALVGEDGVAASLCLTRPLVSVFARPDNPVYDLAVTGNRICTAAMLVLPRVLGVNGIWMATPAAELMALALSAFMFLKYRKRYGY
jgi:Na+-driven multidrug efflux pump